MDRGRVRLLVVKPGFVDVLRNVPEVQGLAVLFHDKVNLVAHALGGHGVPVRKPPLAERVRLDAGRGAQVRVDGVRFLGIKPKVGLVLGKHLGLAQFRDQIVVRKRLAMCEKDALKRRDGFVSCLPVNKINAPARVEARPLLADDAVLGELLKQKQQVLALGLVVLRGLEHVLKHVVLGHDAPVLFKSGKHHHLNRLHGLLKVAESADVADGGVLNLAHALPRHLVVLADLFKGLVALAVQTKPAAQDILLAAPKLAEELGDDFNRIKAGQLFLLFCGHYFIQN